MMKTRIKIPAILLVCTALAIACVDRKSFDDPADGFNPSKDVSAGDVCGLELCGGADRRMQDVPADSVPEIHSDATPPLDAPDSQQKDVQYTDVKNDAVAPDAKSDADPLEVVCTPACDGKKCGGDGCGNSCGSCAEELICHEGACVECWDDTDWDWDGCDAGTIVEFRVNDSVMGKQSSPAVSSFPDGGYIAIWGGDTPELDALYGRRFGADGQAVTSGVSLSDYACQLDTTPALVTFASGDSVACWTTFDDSNDGVACRRLEQNLTPAGAGFLVNTYTASEQAWPSIAGLPDDGFFVSWHGSGQGAVDVEVWGKYFNSTGQVMKSDFQVNSYEDKAQVFPDVASFSDGSSVVVWRSTGGPGTEGSHPYARFFNQEGANTGEEFRVDSESEDYGEFPVVVASNDGTVTIAWTKWTQDGTNPDIYARRFNSSGVSLGPGQLVSASPAGKQMFADIARLDSGGFVVVWHSQDESVSPRWGVFGQLFDGDLTKQGQEFQINTSTNGDSNYPQVESLPGIGFVVVWGADLTPDEAGGGDVHAQRFDESGKRLHH